MVPPTTELPTGGWWFREPTGATPAAARAGDGLDGGGRWVGQSGARSGSCPRSKAPTLPAALDGGGRRVLDAHR